MPTLKTVYQIMKSSLKVYTHSISLPSKVQPCSLPKPYSIHIKSKLGQVSEQRAIIKDNLKLDMSFWLQWKEIQKSLVKMQVTRQLMISIALSRVNLWWKSIRIPLIAITMLITKRWPNLWCYSMKSMGMSWSTMMSWILLSQNKTKMADLHLALRPPQVRPRQVWVRTYRTRGPTSKLT